MTSTVRRAAETELVSDDHRQHGLDSFEKPTEEAPVGGRNIRFPINRGLTLAAVHAARRLTIAGRIRPLDDLALKLLLDWLGHRSRRWPNTGNLHLLINSQTASTTGCASSHWTSAAMRGQDATPERLRVDRQLEEAMVKGPDPLHLVEVFGLDEKRAMRYADSAHRLLGTAAEQNTRLGRQ
ncbi:hypothetical protein ACWGPD_06525 [Streptomyces hirsutus]|uniref:hypothetical protein n=1 Tax=Streptomyces hirsutus TaxID=35620 RepID=UPI00362BAB79